MTLEQWDGHDVSRAQFLRRGAAAAALVAAGGGIAAPAAVGCPPPAPVADDVGYVAFGAAAERVLVDFYDRAIRVGDWSRSERARLVAARAEDRDHYLRLLAVLGDEAPAPGDFATRLPARRMRSKRAILALGEELERLVLGAYLAGVSNAQEPGTRLLLGRLLVSETRHVAALRRLAGRPASTGLPAPIYLERAGARLEPYLEVPSAP